MFDHINAINKVLDNGGASKSSNSSDYLSEIPRTGLNPWPKSRMPIKIFIEPADQVEGYKTSYGNDLNAALSVWESVLSSYLSFQLVDKKDGCDIYIHWSHDTSNAVMKAEGGDCKHRATGMGMDYADVTLLTLDPSPSIKLADPLVSWVCMHELGHALGIGGHSSNPADVMFFASPQSNKMPALSQRDLDTFHKLYGEKLPDTWLSLNDEGNRMMGENRIDQAIEKFDGALKLNSNEPIIKQNLIIAEGRKGIDLMNKQDYVAAEQHMKRAMDFELEVRDNNFQLILKNYSVLLRNAGRAGEVGELYKRYK
jgi:predicted Zn-dependent protease